MTNVLAGNTLVSRRFRIEFRYFHILPDYGCNSGEYLIGASIALRSISFFLPCRMAGVGLESQYVSKK